MVLESACVGWPWRSHVLGCLFDYCCIRQDERLPQETATCQEIEAQQHILWIAFSAILLVYAYYHDPKLITVASYVERRHQRNEILSSVVRISDACWLATALFVCLHFVSWTIWKYQNNLLLVAFARHLGVSRSSEFLLHDADFSNVTGKAKF